MDRLTSLLCVLSVTLHCVHANPPHDHHLAGSKRNPKLTQEPEPKTRRDNVFISSEGCKYTGKRYNKEECKKFGENGHDFKICKSRGGDGTCYHCDAFPTLRTKYCPVTCGLCEPPCNGKKCIRGGVMNFKTCKCSCKNYFTGDLCEKVICPERERHYCRMYDVRTCKTHEIMPGLCPYKCGDCKK